MFELLPVELSHRSKLYIGPYTMLSSIIRMMQLQVKVESIAFVRRYDCRCRDEQGGSGRQNKS
jgi:hypothetical protein